MIMVHRKQMRNLPGEAFSAPFLTGSSSHASSKEKKKDTEMNTQPYAEGGRGPANSLLVADCGTVFTKVSLFGLVEGQYRLMARGEAPTTITPPYEDITKGIIQAINVVEFITGRHFITEGRIISPEQ